MATNHSTEHVYPDGVFLNDTCSNSTNISDFEILCNEWMFRNSTNISTAFDGDAYYFYEAEQFAVLWFLFISIVVGNMSVILALLLSKTRKSRTNFFIMHLAFADLLVGLVSVLTDLIWKMTVSFHGGYILCIIIKYAQTLVTFSSTYVLVALSIDRYDAITHPMNFSGSWRRARYLIMFAWLLSVVFSSPSLFLFKLKVVGGITQCWIEMSEPWQWQIYIILLTLVVFIFPFVIITACYTIIVYTIWSKSKVMSVCASSSSNYCTKNKQNGDKRSSQNDEDSRRASSRGLIPKAKIKTVKMTFVIVCVFVMCWSPYFVFNVLSVFNYFPKTQTMIAVSTFINSLAPLNSAANPIIYCLFSTHLCRNLRRIKVLDVLARALFPCSNCTKQPLDSRGHTYRSGTEYTTMSEISSKRQTFSSVRYTCRFAPTRPGVTTGVCDPSSSPKTKTALNVELLQSSDFGNLPAKPLMEGSAV